MFKPFITKVNIFMLQSYGQLPEQPVDSGNMVPLPMTGLVGVYTFYILVIVAHAF